MRRINKRGQVTLFVILGLVVLIIVGIGIYTINNSKEKQFTKPEIKVGEKFAPVQQYVEQCMNQLLTDGIVKMGQHGGYIDPKDPAMSGRVFNLNTINQHDSDASFLSALDDKSSVIYWFSTSKSGDCKNCAVSTRTPSVADMENQLNRYIKNNIASCLNGYVAFNNRGYYVLDSRNYSVRTSITDSGVASILETNVYLKVSNEEGKLTIFYTDTDIPLKKYYDMATVMTISEAKNNYLENVGLYLLNAHASLDSKKLPPMHDINSGYGVIYWSKTNARKQFEGLLTSYMGALRVPNTKNYVRIDNSKLSPSEKYFYNASVLDFFNNMNLKDTEISFNYQGQNIYMDIVPSDGELIKPSTYTPQEFSTMFKGRIINSYDFYYQASYPVIVEINDEYKPGNHYSFIFALEGNIIDNLRLKDYYNDSVNQIYWDESVVTTKFNKPDDSVDTSGYNLGSKFNAQVISDIKNNLSNTASAFYGGISNPKTKFCEPERRTSGNVEFKTFDSISGDGLSGVTVTFTCGNFVECKIGESGYNQTTAQTSFNSKFPTCLNGYIKLSKQGYLSKNILLSTNSKTKQNLGSIYLDPLVEKEFIVEKHDVVKTVIQPSGITALTLANKSLNITDNESIIITLEKITYDVTEEPYATTAMISKEYGISSKTITLTPGTYTLNIQLLDAAGVVIPKECKAICIDQGTSKCKEYDYIPKDNIEIKPAPWGGIDYTNKTLFYVSPADLAGDNKLVFNVLKLAYPKCLDDMEDVSKIGSLSEKYHTTLMPEFVPVDS